jgi:uncharacterized protein (DUF1697 family)
VPAGVQYLALLRGVNVGGKNLVRMADLRAAFEEMELAEVATYIQSGNVLFRAPRQRREQLAARIESNLSRRFDTELKVVLVTAAHLKDVIEGAPRGFGEDDLHLCDVLFVRKPLTVVKLMSVLELRDGVDSAWPGKGVVYFSRLAARASSSRISKFAGRPEYKNVTIRSWSTTKKLHAVVASASRVSQT